MSTRGSAARRREEVERWLDLYHDGELRGLRRWRFERLLRRNPGLRRELAVRGELGALLREASAATGEPDLWANIASQIADRPRSGGAVKAARTPRSAPTSGAFWGWLSPLRIGPVIAGVATAAALYLAPVAPTTEPVARAAAHHGVVRSIQSRGRPVVVLEGSDEATIIWLMDREGEAEEEQGDGVQV
jgi:hypothetical protein